MSNEGPTSKAPKPAMAKGDAGSNPALGGSLRTASCHLSSPRPHFFTANAGMDYMAFHAPGCGFESRSGRHYGRVAQRIERDPSSQPLVARERTFNAGECRWDYTVKAERPSGSTPPRSNPGCLTKTGRQYHQNVGECRRDYMGRAPAKQQEVGDPNPPSERSGVAQEKCLAIARRRHHDFYRGSP